MIDERIVKIDPKTPDRALIDRAAGLLRDGAVVVAPTETRYGLLVRADSQQALDRLYRLKDRPVSMPTAIFVGSTEDITEHAEINTVAEQVAAAFLPGPLTLILRARTPGNAPVVVDGKIGLRISSSPVIAKLVDVCDFPLSATSANRSGAPDSVSAEDVAAVFPEGVDIILDAGGLELPPSTVVDCAEGEVRIIREGAISREQISAVVRKVNC